MADLAPSILPTGEAPNVPERIDLSFAVAMAPEQQPEIGTKIELEPGGVELLSWPTPRTLRIVPSEPLPPDARITLRVEAIRTRFGTVEGPALEHVFRTPKFAASDARALRVGHATSRAEVQLTFTGPVDVQRVRDHLTVSLGARPATSFEVHPTERAHAVKVTVEDRLVARGSPVRLSVRKGLSMRGHPARTLQNKDFRVEIAPSGRKMQILSSSLEEGSEGWFFRVVCSDDAAGSAKRYFWDAKSRRSYRISPRCSLTETSVRTHVHVEPATKLRISATRGGFRLLGNLPRGPVRLTVDAGARTIDGGYLETAYTQEFDVPRRSPRLSFAAQGRYVPRDQLSHIPVQSLNINRARVQVERVPPENIVFWASGADEPVTPRTADLVLESEISLGGTVDELMLHSVDLRSFLGRDQRGLFEVTLEEIIPEGEKDREPSRSVLRVVATDLALIAKRGRNAVHAWVLDSHTLAPQSAVRLRLVQPSGTDRARCQTDRSGGCLLPLSEFPGSVEPFGIVAEREKDLVYLAFDEVETPTAEADVGGFTPDKKVPYRAAAWFDRGIFRPGETAHLTATVWRAGPEEQERPKATPAGLPVELRLLDPKGKELGREVLETSTNGVVSKDYRFGPTARTGRYRVELRVGDARLLTETLQVQAFVPERMKVSAEAERPFFVGAGPRFEVRAQWLFGGKAAGSPVELRCQFNRSRPRFSTFGNFSFGRIPDPTEAQQRALGAAKGVIGADGTAQLTCPENKMRRLDDAGHVDAEIAVFEGGSGRTTRASARAWIYPAELHVGLRADREVAKVGETVRLNGVLATGDGKLAPRSGKVTLELFRVERERDWVFDSQSRSWSYREYRRLASEGRTQAEAENGRFSASLTPATPSGHYLIRASVQKIVGELKLKGTGSDFGDWAFSRVSDDQTPKPAAPTSVPLELPKEIRPGETAVAKARIPFSGRALFVVETDRLLHHEWRDVSPGTAEFRFSVDAFVPNVYVSVLALKDPHEASRQSFVPARGFGVGSIRVAADALTIPLTIQTPKEIRSTSTLEVTLRGAPAGAEAVVAVVDEGILSLTRFETPDPLAELFPRRALGVRTYDTPGWNLVLPGSGPAGATGGDGMASPGAAMPVEPVALWSGVVSLDAGETTLTFDVPEYRGTLRVMAMAISPNRIGRAESKVVVRDPVVLEPTVPRVLTVQDEAEVPILVSNVSGERRELRVSLSGEPLGPAEGGIDASTDFVQLLKLTPAAQTLNLADGATKTIWFSLKARASAGAARIRATATWEGGQTTASQNVVLRPKRPRERASVLTRAQDQVDVRMAIGDWVPGTEQTKVVLTRNPFIRSATHFDRLIDYPYGCAEQTTSRTRALMYVDRFLGPPPSNKKHESKPPLEELIRAGIDRLLSMQTVSGGFAFWPGREEPSTWASAYVIDLLLDLSSDGYPVPDAAKSRALEWAEEVVERKPQDLAVPYLHFVLAKAQRPRHTAIAALLSGLNDRKLWEGERREMRFLLLAAQYLGGDRRNAESLRAFSKNLEVTRPFSAPGYSFYTERRRRALEFAVLVELFGSETWLRPVAEGMTSVLDGPSWSYTTQELAWSLTGLGRFVGKVSKKLPEARLAVDGRTIDAESGPGGSLRWDVLRASERTRATLQLNPAEGPSPYVLLLSEGVRPEGVYRLGGEGLRVTRRLVNTQGEPVSDGSLTLGDLIYSVVEVQNLTGRSITNLALVDVFPAGLEPAALSLADIQAPSWLRASERWSTDHADLRDDRVAAFGTLPAGAKARVFFVPLRAVSAGTFAHPPVSLEGMYAPSLWARAAGESLVVARD